MFALDKKHNTPQITIYIKKMSIAVPNGKKYIKTSENKAFKGVLHPRLVFGLFLHFSQKLQHIGNK